MGREARVLGKPLPFLGSWGSLCVGDGVRGPKGGGGTQTIKGSPLGRGDEKKQAVTQRTHADRRILCSPSPSLTFSLK